jgi:hypothetical protein
MSKNKLTIIEVRNRLTGEDLFDVVAHPDRLQNRAWLDAFDCEETTCDKDFSGIARDIESSDGLFRYAGVL